MTYLDYKALHGPDVAPGTFAAQQLLARWERDEQLTEGAPHDIPLVNELYCCGSEALRHALAIVRMSRSSEKIDPSAFVAEFVRLEAFVRGLHIIRDKAKALRDWPKEPGFIFGGRSGWSAFEAAIAFSNSIHDGVVIARALHRLPSRGEPYASQLATGDCGPDIVGWCNRAMEELSTKTCPATHVWPTPAELHSAAQSIGYKIADEFERAVSASRRNRPRYVLTDAVNDCAEAVDQYAALRVRLFGEVVSLKEQKDGRWSIRYKRDPAKGARDIKAKVVEHVTTDFAIADLPLEAGVATLTMPETYAPFHDFELFNADGVSPAEGTDSWRIGKRIELLLERLLATARQLMRSIETIEREVKMRGLHVDTNALSQLALEFPVFPYWTPPRGKTFKAMQASDFDEMISREAPLLDRVRLSLRLLANEENGRLEHSEAPDALALQIQEQLTAVGHAETAHEKGKALERLIAALLPTVQGFVVTECNLNTETEEIDIVVENRSNTYPWNRESPLLLVECKNWSTPADKNALVSLEKKMMNRRGKCRLGIFVAWSGFTSKTDLELLRSSREDWIILQLDGETVAAAVKMGTFANLLHQTWRVAALR